MKNKLFFKILKFIKALDLTADDIALETTDSDQMTELATKIFGALLNLSHLESDYYEIVTDLFDCTDCEAEDLEIMDVLMEIIASFKKKKVVNFSSGVLENTK